MILVTKNNVSAELLKKIIDDRRGRRKFLLQTCKGIHTAELHSSMEGGTRYIVRHIANSPYAVILKGSSSTYIGGNVTTIARCIKNEDYDFFIRRQSQ